jgi:hypothetical protein
MVCFYNTQIHDVTEADLLKEFQNEVNLALVPSLGVEVSQPLEDTLKIRTYSS